MPMTANEFMLFRRSLKMTQGDMANALGVSRFTVNNWEREKFAVPRDIVERIAAKGIGATTPVLAAEQRNIIAEDLAWYRLWRSRGYSHTDTMAARRPPAMHIAAVSELSRQYPDFTQ